MSRSGQEAPRMSGSSREAFPDVRECFGGTPECPGVVEMPSRMSGSSQGPSWMSGNVDEALPEVQ